MQDIHIQSSRVIFRHQHSWEQQSQMQRRNHQLKQEIWACKPLCLCKSYPVPEGNRDMWRQLEKVCSLALHPEKPQDLSETVEVGFPYQWLAWLPLSEVPEQWLGKASEQVCGSLTWIHPVSQPYLTLDLDSRTPINILWHKLNVTCWGPGLRPLFKAFLTYKQSLTQIFIWLQGKAIKNNLL